MCMSVLSICMYVHCMRGGQNGALDLLELELKMM